jgi:uncharacterized 2Fe-2S/4Fe-4S cluster protein (DUF4445 family)
MNIEWGMRAEPGAISAVRIIGSTLEIETIGSAKPRGICGTGLVDAVAELLKAGIIDRTGRLLPPDRWNAAARAHSARYGASQGGAFFLDSRVCITQADIRQVQLAKGAIRSGIECLLKREGLKPSGVAEIIVAGGFGYRLNPGNMKTLGFFPEGAASGMGIRFAGNTSRAGAEILLKDGAARETAEWIARNITAIELSGEGDFEKEFMESMEFPVQKP